MSKGEFKLPKGKLVDIDDFIHVMKQVGGPAKDLWNTYQTSRDNARNQQAIRNNVMPLVERKRMENQKIMLAAERARQRPNSAPKPIAPRPPKAKAPRPGTTKKPENQSKVPQDKKELGQPSSVPSGGRSEVAAAYGNRMYNRSPLVEEIKKGGVTGKRITHREYVADFQGTSAFTTFVQDAAPTSETFPWLSTECAGWQYYHFLKLNLELVTSRGTSDDGVVMVAPIGDPNETIPTTKGGMLNFVGSSRAVAWQGLNCVAPKIMLDQVKNRNISRGFALDVLDTSLLTAEAVAPDSDPHFVSPLRFVVATDGYANEGVAGEVWVNYCIDMWEPRPISLGIQSLAIQGNDISGGEGIFANMSWRYPPGNLLVTDALDVAGNAFVMNQPGDFLLVAVLEGTGIGTMSIGTTGNNALLEVSDHVVNSGATSSMLTQAIRTNDTDDYFSIDLPHTTISNFKLSVVRVAPGSMGSPV